MTKMDIYVLRDKETDGTGRQKYVFGWDGEDLFIQSEDAGMSREEALMLCAYDGERCCIAENKLLIRESFARREKPEREQVFDAIRMVATKYRDVPHASTNREDASGV